MSGRPKGELVLSNPQPFVWSKSADEILSKRIGTAGG